MRDTIRLYSDQSPSIRLFVRLRHLLSPLEVLEEKVPKRGNILDLGCGHGLFTNYMALRASSRNIVGIDPSIVKFKVAKKTEDRVPNVHYILGNITDAVELGHFDAITIVDVLYLLPEAEQIETIKTCYRLLSDSGVLLLKTQDTRPLWRFVLTYAQETVMVNARLTLGSKKLHFIAAPKTRKILKAAGFSVEYFKLPSSLFYPHIAFVCKKEEQREE